MLHHGKQIYCNALDGLYLCILQFQYVTSKCNVHMLPRRLLEHHKALVMFFFFLPCSCNVIYLPLTSRDRSLNQSWSCEGKHWIMSHVPSVGMHNPGQKGPGTYGCHIKIYVRFGDGRATRWVLWKWTDIWESGSSCDGNRVGAVQTANRKPDQYICCKYEWFFKHCWFDCSF